MKQGIFMRAFAAETKEAVIDVVGVIGWEVWYGAMRDMIKAIPETVERVVFEIYSPGGDVWEGNAIVQAIGAMKQHTIARVQVAASMATLIAVACKERQIASNGRWLIHNPWTQLAGDAATLEKRAKELRDCQAEAAKFYADRTGQPVEKMMALMDEERWLTPAEAKELGFVQAVDNPFDASKYESVKAEIEAAGKWPKALVEIPAEPEQEKPNDANTDGTEGNGGGATVPADKPTVPDNAIEEARKLGVAEGLEQAKSHFAVELERIEKLHASDIAKRESLIKSLQSAKDKAEAQIVANQKHAESVLDDMIKKSDAAVADRDSSIKSLTECLTKANNQIAKLLRGGMAFEPAPIETWEEALQSCKGDYVEAARKYPKLRDAYNSKHSRK